MLEYNQKLKEYLESYDNDYLNENYQENVVSAKLTKEQTKNNIKEKIKEIKLKIQDLHSDLAYYYEIESPEEFEKIENEYLKTINGLKRKSKYYRILSNKK